MLKVNSLMVSGALLAGRIAGLPLQSEACRVHANIGHGLMVKTTNLPMFVSHDSDVVVKPRRLHQGEYYRTQPLTFPPE